MTDKAFSPDTLEAFRSIYPEHSARIRHNLAGHPMFELDALVALAGRMRPEDAEYNRGDLPVGIDPSATPSNGLSIQDTIRSIEECGSWMVLKFVEQDPAYRDLLHSILGEIEPVVRPLTGEMLTREAFIFISSPDAVTPFHIDPEHNILLQLRGQKTMNVFPVGDEAIASSESQETFHTGGHRNLPWRDEFAPKAKAIELRPGDAVHVPVKAPHWVKNGPEVSISLSITWRSSWSYQEADAHRLNRMLRNAGIAPTPPKRFPARNTAKSVAYRGIMKAKRVLKAD